MQTIKKRPLGNSDIDITVLGVGTFALGGPNWTYSWGPQEDRDSIEAIRAALEAGVNWIDTAAVYGFGHAEELVARAVEPITPKPYLFTKCERNWNERGEIVKCLKRESIRKECEDSLRRLRVDAIDLYQIHWPEPDEDIEEGWETLARLKEEGKVRWIGVSNFSAGQMRRCAAIAPITSLQPPYSAVNRAIEDEVLPYCQAGGIGVIVHSPMRNGLLTGKMTRERALSLPSDDYRSRLADFREPLLSRNLAVADALRQIGERHGRTAGEVAIAWTLRHPAVTATIFGARSRAQLDETIGAAWFRLSDAEAEELRMHRAAAG